MNPNNSGDKKIFLEELHKSGLKMLVIIVNRADGEKVTKSLREKHFRFQFVCLAQGTAGSEILDLLGFGTTDKSVVLCVAPGFRISTALTEMSDELKLAKKGKGIAFTIPLFGINLPSHSSDKDEIASHLQENIEKEVDKMNDSITHSVIIAVVNQGNSEELVEAARAAGATGGTVINARRAGTEEAVKFLGISVQEEKEIVAILTKREKKSDIMEAINTSFGATSPAKGIILSLPVDGVAGLS